MRTDLLPPSVSPDRLQAELRLTPRRDREDAAQEAWVAHLTGGDPARAVNTFATRERRHRARCATGVIDTR